MVGGVLVGTFFIALGVSIILKAFFNIEIPVLKTFMAIALILFGISLIAESIFYKPFCITFNY